MPAKYIRPIKCFLTSTRKRDIPIYVVKEKSFTAWEKKQNVGLQAAIKESGFKPSNGKVLLHRGAKGTLDKIYLGAGDGLKLYDTAALVSKLSAVLSDKALKECSFSLITTSLGASELEIAANGWGRACYAFDIYKKHSGVWPALVWPKGVDKTRVQAMVQGINLVRDLVNIPANDMGPDELEKAAREVAKTFKATVAVKKGKPLEDGFPLVHAVGMGSPRRPRLIDFKWGNAKHPKLTLVGKGVVFDTGGLDIKPSQYMALMKKDMAGSAHVLGLAYLIMKNKLPVRLRVLIPAVENSVSGDSFRPGDIFTSRKGLTVENTNTDAEGRLILADALTLASEEKTDLIIDFATLTGSARAALGQEIPAMFSTNDKIAEKMKKLSMDAEDAVWPMPLWEPYNKIIESSNADLHNSASVPGDLIYSALFLKSFLNGTPDWVHLDCFAWEAGGKPGRPKGGCDTGLRAAYALIEDRYKK